MIDRCMYSISAVYFVRGSELDVIDRWACLIVEGGLK